MHNLHIIPRTHCSLFDVSHMLQTRVWGRDRVAFMESLTTADVDKMAENTGSLTVFTNEKGKKYKQPNEYKQTMHLKLTNFRRHY